MKRYDYIKTMNEAYNFVTTILESECTVYAYISGTVNSLKTLAYHDKDLNNEDIRKICDYGNSVTKKVFETLK